MPHISRHTSLQRLVIGLIAAAAALLACAAAPATSLAAPCDAPITNPVLCENSKTGSDPSTWEIDKAGDSSLQGYATSMSVNKGQTVSFKIKAASSNFHIDVYRLGYYGGDGARLQQSLGGPTGPTTQPACQQFAASGLIDCGNWSVSASWNVPSTAVSGVYIAHLVNNTNPDVESHITFVVRDDSSQSAVLVQTSDETWQAYNTYGGNSLYQCTVSCPDGDPSTYKAAYKVSYNRPFNTAEDDSGRSWVFSGGEYPMIRFLERNGYNVSYVSGVDVQSNPAVLQNHKVFMSSGHDEYWAKQQRANVTAARNNGLNLAFFTGNEMFWKTRFESSAAGTSTPNRTLVSYKDTHFPEQQDPVEWTGTWRDPRFASDAADVVPENALTGQSFIVNSGTSQITVPAAYKNQRMWRNTTAGALTFPMGTLGYEWDEDPDNGFRPAGQIRMSSTTVSGVEVFTDYGSTTKNGGTATHNLTMYRAPGGARVFGSGTVQWAWGLDDENEGGVTPDRNMQQATVNLLADMGSQPGSLMSGIVAASASTDSTAPTAAVTGAPATVADGTPVNITGTATDAGGGVVAGVEVSTDGGTTWHPATTGTTSWSYSWIAHGNPSTTIKVRATDDSGNLGNASAGTSVAVTCPCSIWGTNTSVPVDDRDSGDPTPVEVGVKFKSDKFGTISGLRFYKAATNTGTHVGTLWSESGQELAQATFSGETASGWQTVTFNSPVAVQPNTTYVASYHAPAGHYSATSAYFYNKPAPGPSGGAVVDSPPLHATRNSGTTVNGVYSYGAAGTFPINSFAAGNYWVDVMFSPTALPGAVTGVTATTGGLHSANVSWSAPATGGAVTSYRITPYVGSTAQTATTITGSPPVTTTTISGLTTGTTYTFKVEAVNPNGAGPVSAASNSVTPAGAVAPSVPQSVAAQGATQSARVTWTAPQTDGDSAITGYTVTPYLGPAAQTPVQAGPSATSATINGLTNGTSYTFKVTATNGAGTSPAGTSNAVTPQATIFDLATPDTADSGDGSSVELGVKFKADYTGTINGVRFYKSSGNTGTHIGSLWSASGTRLAQANFSGESDSGWQSVTFASSVAVTAGTTYVASYFAPKGHYSVNSQGLSSAVDNGALHTIPNATSGNGVYAYSAASTFPNNSYNATNYWVDVMYAFPTPGQVTNVVADSGGATSADVSWNAPASGGPVTSYKITPYLGSVAQTATTISGSPPATSKKVNGLTTGSSYTFTVQAINANGAGVASAQSNAVTPAAAVAPGAPTDVAARPATQSALVSWSAPSSDGDSPITGYTVTPYVGATAQTAVSVGASTTSKTVTGLDNGTAYTFKVKATNAVGTGAASAASSAVTPAATVLDFTTPSTIDSGDNGSVTLGMKFQTDFTGTATGVRFYKAAGNTGTHVGALWTAGGTLLAQATFSSETATGWQHVLFSSPVSLSANTTYVVSYLAPNGNYSVTAGGFASAIDNPPLHGLSNGTSANGLFAYGGASTFPTASYNAGNYGVDVLFQPAAAPGTPTSVSATAGSAAANVSWTAPSTGGPPTSYKITPYIGATAQTTTTVSGSPPATSKTVSGLTPGTSYTFTVRASNPGGSGPESAASAAVIPTGAAAPAAPTNATAEADSTSAFVDWTAPSDEGGSDITGYTVTPYVGAAAQSSTDVGASTTKTRITGLTNGTSYTFKIKATNSAGSGPASSASNAVAPKRSLFELTTPPTVDAGDGSATVLGAKFTSDTGGSITGIRFYKASANTGSHIGALWSAGGTKLAEGSFSGESASGWQTLTLATPVTVTADTTYVVSYLAPNGHYSVTGAGFSSAFDNPPLHALANATSANGVYAYSGTSVFPTSTWNSTNYWVDVLFAPGS
jgi:N,N-dimethylformamidase beta subunit-like, C-terminal/Domain of unknown function (DUF4082)/Fibronectin type III domain